MKRTWRKTPPQWAMADAAAYYAAMAAKGWILEKVGIHWDRYRRAEPQQLQFWVELSLDGGSELPEEQIQLYDESGWTLMAQKGQMYVFAAQLSAQTPEPYAVDDPQQDRMLRCVQRNYRNGIISMVVMLLLAGVWVVTVHRASLPKLLMGCWLLIPWLLWILCSVWDTVYGFGALTRMRAKLKRGERPEAKRRLGYRLSLRVMSVLAALCLLIGGAAWISAWRGREPLPAQSNGDYLIVSQLSGQRRDEISVYAGMFDVNYVEQAGAFPFYRAYQTCEGTKEGEKERVIFQDVYILRWHGLAGAMADSLRNNGMFAKAEAYVPVEIDGLDQAWYVPGGMEYVAAAGNRLVYGTVTGTRPDDAFLLTLLRETAKLWNP